MSLIRLVYASESRLVDANRRMELNRMLASAGRFNDQNGITGFLLATDKAFAQVLEGPQANVAETYGRIVMDPRHAAVRLLIEEPIAPPSPAGQWASPSATRRPASSSACMGSRRKPISMRNRWRTSSTSPGSSRGGSAKAPPIRNEHDTTATNAV